MTTQRHDHELAARLYQPSSTTMARQFSDVGQEMAGAFAELARNPTRPQCDAVLDRLHAACHAVSRLRAALVAEGGP